MLIYPARQTKRLHYCRIINFPIECISYICCYLVMFITVLLQKKTTAKKTKQRKAKWKFNRSFIAIASNRTYMSITIQLFFFSLFIDFLLALAVDCIFLFLCSTVHSILSLCFHFAVVYFSIVCSPLLLLSLLFRFSALSLSLTLPFSVSLQPFVRTPGSISLTSADCGSHKLKCMRKRRSEWKIALIHSPCVL